MIIFLAHPIYQQCAFARYMVATE